MENTRTAPPPFLKMRTRAQVEADRFDFTIRKSPRDEAEARRAAKAATRRALGLDR